MRRIAAPGRSAKKEAQELAKRDAELKAKRESEDLAKRGAEDLKKLDAEEAERSKLSSQTKLPPVAEPAGEKAPAAKAADAVDSKAADPAKSGDFWGSVTAETKQADESKLEATAELKAVPQKLEPEKPEPAKAAEPAAAKAEVEAPKPAAKAEPVAAAPEPAVKAESAAAAPEPTNGDGAKGNKNAELLAAATKAAKAVEQAEPGSAAKEELKGALITSLSRLAESYYEQNDHAEAQGLYERILMLRQSQLGPRHPR